MSPRGWQTRELQAATSQTLGYLVCDVFVFFACIIVALVYSYKLTLVMLATGVPSALILWGFSRFLDPAIEGQKRELAQAAKHVTAATTAIDLVKVYNGADHEAFQFVSAIRRSAKFYSRQVLCNCGQMSYSIETLGPQWLVVAKGMAAGQFLQGLTKEKDCGSEQQATGWLKPSWCAGEVKMSNVNFAYPSNPTKTVIHSSSLKFAAGQLTFLVGSSGSGKSTLGSLLVRFYEPMAGRITLDGTPITTLDLDWLRRNVTLIQQSSSLFSDTLFQNIALGSSEPEGVSHDAAGLDPVSRTLIMEAIRVWRKGKTTIIITHEVNHIADDEYVYVLADGSVVQEGLRRDIEEDETGLFASLVASANNASSGGSVFSDSESEFDSDLPDDSPAEEAQYAKLLRGALVDNRPMSRAKSYQRGRSMSHHTDVDPSQYGYASRSSSIHAVTQRGLGVQKNMVGKGQLILGIMLCLVIAASNPVFSYFFANLVGEFWIAEGEESSVSLWAGLLAVIAVIDASATFFGYFLMEKVAQKWVNTLRAEAIKRILSQPRPWFDKPSHSPARITQCLDRNAEEMRKLVGMFVPILLTITAMILASTCLGAGYPMGPYTGDARWAARGHGSGREPTRSETFANIKVIRALTLERHFYDKHSRSTLATYRLGVKRAGFVGLFYGVHQSIIFFLTSLVFYYGAKILSEGLITVTDVVRVINLLLFALGTSVAMLGNLPQIAAAKTTAVQMLYYANLSHTASHEGQGEKRLLTPLPVRMANLRFAYPGAPQTEVLRNINLQIDAGTCTAIVGASGCGKTTIASLLLRLYDPLPPLPPRPTPTSLPTSKIPPLP
ncbi:hypothetical protein CHGG_09822 [Chaetomium globosum CBS 148.51]|uniref:ABC transmembrane type-1 domain-containing protein n=1 Tax=Chaetomium globosum (strain ATCC 6205 / CBS 148.51 / DSM 1962 / NBRC 6347 / NRRL 1970) TaxID=306901 RepID=Q2GQD2_CHAGB|nr:uncharacterized protein CHGG_09822 [Chaetomium globosum CBS 148.51]EAQ83418.1 hypothetical protein CHGG_09822 [Chaetomium globosum CBS 148.51]